jgi:DNA-binding NarL/FixJ family response regulator
MINVVLFEDNPQLREGLSMLIGSTDGYRVTGAFKDCTNLADDLKRHPADVVLMDIDMPSVNGIEALKMIRKDFPDVKVLMLTVFDDNKNIFEALKSGANGYILKKTQPAKLLEYINDAFHGGAPMSSSVATQVLTMFSKLENYTETDYNLSERERQVLQLLVNGYSYKMIAAEMFIAIDTVRSHIKKIYEKLHVNSKSEAVATAFRNKLF